MQEFQKKRGLYNGEGKEEKKLDERLKNIMDNLDARRIGLYESFKFHCTCYGKCCTHREDILLDPRDVYNMSRELGML